MFEETAKTSGFFHSVRTALDSGLGLIQNRVELFSLELQEEKWRLLQTLLGAAALAALGTITLVLVTLVVVFACWENARLTALSILSIVYGVGTLALFVQLRKQIKQNRPLSATTGELERDRACLRNGN